MKRTFATLGIAGLGLGLISVTAPAMAASDRVVVCHTDGSSWTPLEFDVNGIGGHVQHPTDIIPPTPKAPEGKNWTTAGQALYAEKCLQLPPGEETEVVEPVVVPPVVVEQPLEQPVVNQPAAEQPAVVTPVVEAPVVEAAVSAPVVAPPVQQPAVVPPATVPQAAATVVPQRPAAAAAAATTNLGTNQGYNAQTAVGGSGSPSWLAGVGVLLAAGGAVLFRRNRRALPLAG